MIKSVFKKYVHLKYKLQLMKRYIYVSICVLGLISFTSCRSTSKPCGLADNLIKSSEKISKQPQINQSLEFIKS